MLNYITTNVNKAFLESIIEPFALESCRDMGKKIYDSSQDNCPVATSALKNSGYVTDTAKGCEVGYSADYAEIVDNTSQSELQSGTTHFFTNAILNNKGVAKYECN